MLQTPRLVPLTLEAVAVEPTQKIPAVPQAEAES
jgi:hypothetical protein